LLDLRAFYGLAAAELSSITGLPREYCSDWMSRSHAMVKEALRRGEIDEGDVIGSSTRLAIGLTDPPFTHNELYSAFARAVNAVSGDELLLEGVREVLDALRERGLKLATVGNVIFWPGYLNRILLDRAGLSVYFSAQVYADEVRCLKPNPRIFRIALESLGEDPSGSAHVGDSPGEDFAGSLAAGMASILIRPDGDSITVDRRLRFAIVREIRDVIRVIDEL